MKNKFTDKKTDYTGEQLRSHFIYENFDLQGDAIVSFTGGCTVEEHMVDLDDKKKKEFIFSEKMLHFLAEHFDTDLETMVLRKRLFISIMLEELNRLAGKTVFKRKDNGIYEKDKKLSVAVATVSPVSTLMHVGLNILSDNTPIKTSSLSEHKIDPKKFAIIVMKRYCSEMVSVKISRAKVKAVK